MKKFDTLGELLDYMSKCRVCNSSCNIQTSLAPYKGHGSAYDKDTNSLIFTIDIMGLPKAIITLHSDNHITVEGKNSDYTIARARDTNSTIFASLFTSCPNQCSSSNSEDIEFDLVNYIGFPFAIVQESFHLRDDKIRYDIDTFYEDENNQEMYIWGKEINNLYIGYVNYMNEGLGHVVIEPVEFDFSNHKETIDRIQTYLLLG